MSVHNKQSIFNLKDEHNKKIHTNDTAEHINNFFATIGQTLASRITQPVAQSYKATLLQGQNIPALNFSPITLQQLESVVNKTQIYKSSGITNISTRIWKDVFTAMPEKLLHILNMSLTTAIFPTAWKEALVVPIPKINNPSNVNDLKPISLLPLPGKILESLIHQQLSAHLENNKLINDSQNGFRKDKSTTDTTFQLITEILNTQNQGKSTSAVFIDFKKAFDTVSHPILLEKLKNFYLHSTILSWLENYLSGRKQQTLANGRKSGWHATNYGVPHGSILGPLLLPQALNNSRPSLYADDAVAHCSGSTVAENINTLQDDITKLGIWCNLNLLTVNTAKTKVVHFGTKETRYPDITLNGEKLQVQDTYKYLGFTLDNKLTLKQQLSITQRNVSHKLYLFKKIRNYLSNKAAKDVLKAMVLSYIDYANIFFTLCNKADNDKLQVLQNNAMRMCCNIRNPREASVRQLHKDLNLLTVQNRRYVTLLCCIYRHVKSGYIQTVERTEVHTRANMTNIIKLPIARSKQFQNSPFYFGVKMWNALPISLRSAVDLKGFKKELKSLYFSQQSA